MSARAGHSLAEAVAALVAGSVLLGVAAALLRLQVRIVVDVRDAATAVEGARTTWGVLAAELRYADAAADIRAASAESLALRAFRGVALPCEEAQRFAYRGIRRPAVGKDSVVGVISGKVAVIVEAGDAAASAGVAACAPPGALLLRMLAEPQHTPAEPLLVFESGAYHIAAGALRYRLGAEGRQPLTEEWLDAGQSRIQPGATSAAPLALRLAAKPIGRAAPRTELATLPTLNAAHVRPPDR